MTQLIQEELAARQSTTVTPPLPGLTPPLGLREPQTAPTAGPDVALRHRLRIADSWATELVCDLAMAKRFGPAAAAALGSYLTAIGDYRVVSSTHPPGHLRVSLIASYLDGVVEGELGTVLDPWRDVAPDGAEPPWSAALAGYLREHVAKIAQLVNGWEGARYPAEADHRQTAVRLARRQLMVGLPPHDGRLSQFPDTVEGDGATTSESNEWVTLTDADIINAGWATLMGSYKPGELDTALTPHVDRLILKALETRQLLDAIALGTPPGEPNEAKPVARQPYEAASDTYKGAVLGTAAIENRLGHPDPWRRIVITPLIGGAIGDASIDIRLGNRFIIFQRTSTTSFNALKDNNPRTVQREVERGWGSPFVLHPGEVVLAAALEYLALPTDVAAQVITRSSYGRLGLITATAAQVHPLYRGCLTLELVNLGTVPLELYPGERVAQLVFFSVQVPPGTPAPTSADVFRKRYSCPTGPEFPRLTVDPWVQRTLPEVTPTAGS